ncbi:uncharacterized protein LOC124448497 [Xenia sp. Carnegie-2017]|uniref:uncharacterized protein LOC124448497 n=1 Tax=Xenia sp. Carnegie-2017 TaxID=2897299 RepID=UPI001F03AB4C|nr:uncharacterized protein LOC124448497 [Xenia sp. Carnegie-2017]XP_046855470.1 uncharacterized protein LOC124448497 [Xenia sp. Carnegie-2017]XP_046855471.1 uncharacterized protein LOC124448497 [Xenia sp. Carnegie-2017]
MKRDQVQYRKNWIAANKALRCSDAIPNDDGCSNLFNNVFDNDRGLSQPLQKSTRTIASPKQSSFYLKVGLDDCDIGENVRAVSGEVDILDVSFCHGKADSLVNVNADIGEMHCSVSSDFEDDSLKVSFQDGLIDWVNEYSIKQNAVDVLLDLNKDNGHPNLPSCACTLLHTS